MRLSSLDIHAFQAVGYLGLHPDRWVTASEICAQTQLSRAFMVRVLAVLVRGQVILSKKGACGGYRLARPADTVTLRDVVHGLDRPVAPLTCVSLSRPVPCTQSGCCQLSRDVYTELRDATHRILARYTAADLARDLKAGVAYSACLDHLWHPQLGAEQRPPAFETIPVR